MSCEEALEKLTEADNEDMPMPGPLTTSELLLISQILGRVATLPVAVFTKQAGRLEKDFSFMHAAATNIKEWFPVPTVVRRCTVVASTYTTLFYIVHEDLEDELFNLDMDVQELH